VDRLRLDVHAGYDLALVVDRPRDDVPVEVDPLRVRRDVDARGDDLVHGGRGTGHGDRGRVEGRGAGLDPSGGTTGGTSTGTCLEITSSSTTWIDRGWTSRIVTRGRSA
jgi:hypothetical protein